MAVKAEGKGKKKRRCQGSKDFRVKGSFNARGKGGGGADI